MRDADYVIIGAGSAGCVLAARLSEDSGCNVLLMEAGGSDRSIYVQMPAALSIPMNLARFNWGYTSQAEPHLNGRVIDCPRGRVLGGSSSINGMVYVRGHPRDFDRWEELGADGWNYASCLPYFKKAESWVDGENDYRGGHGPLSVCAGNNMTGNSLYEAFIQAGHEAGYPVTDDYNGCQQEGFGAMHMTVRDGVRASTASAYLRPAMNRSNLRYVGGTYVHRVLFEKSRAVAVEYEKDGRIFQVQARREVLMATGSIGSPSLLQRSGIGSAHHLESLGIEVQCESPGVGENLQDHLEVYFQFRCKQPITLNRYLNPLAKGLIGARWLFTRTGLGATNHFESCGFIRSRAGVQWPDIQYHFLPGAMRYDGRAAFPGHGFQVHVGPNKPQSRGCVKIVSQSPKDSPKILFNYLEAQQDREDWRACIHLTREIFEQPAMEPFRGAEIQPGRSVISNSDIDDWVRQNVESAYHPSCTCRMGAIDDATAVLDSACRVKGVESLRVVDSSVFPEITNGNLNAPTIMLAERVADMILGGSLLPPLDSSVWIDEYWQQRQRVGEPVRRSDVDAPI
ncbi:MAG TPA: choline dehydrogenase [Gammaproteobacteria bacterium]|nr:choline dehydrogenase [Gammaproteobacteria bacterium]HBK74829.1 choline dehydrogenase [Gammaproteobacteria bacterium]HHZ72980.1 choline dehydrogenase [Gammaproteobacteria bacterium]HIA42518.1 choline dehydrogenase [Gammaproteobacteria bacterium]HIB07160.1 choline dehydrogenase [Gammaproteobacteria bacterium]